MAPETGFLREAVGKNEVFSSKNPVSLVGCVSPDQFSANIDKISPDTPYS